MTRVPSRTVGLDDLHSPFLLAVGHARVRSDHITRNHVKIRRLSAHHIKITYFHLTAPSYILLLGGTCAAKRGPLDMPAASACQNALGKELMALQLGQLDLLMAMYSPDDAVHIDTTSLELFERLKEWCESDADKLPSFSDPSISMLLDLDLSDSPEVQGDEPRSLQLNLTIPLVQEGDSQSDPPPIKSRLQQPSWLSKNEVAAINANLPDEDILSVIEHIKNTVAEKPTRSNTTPSEANGLFDKNAPLVRAWFYFPSISTREKRDDLVKFAPMYGLSGFLMAGKPGILCLEGGSIAIDDFMKFIKTDSWGDIPPQHKKVSERYRETDLDSGRAFTDMQEITETVGERRGERANRSDMKALEAWLVDRGLGAAFGQVFM